MKDGRVLGRSYGYVIVPPPGKTLFGVKFPPGPRAMQKAGWHKLLVEAGCEEITEQEYLAKLSAPVGPVVAAPAEPGENKSAEPVVRTRRRQKAARAS